MAAAVFMLLLVQVLVLPLPEQVVRHLVLRADGWILGTESPSPSGPAGYILSASRKIYVVFVQQSLIAHISRTQSVPVAASDPERIVARLAPLKSVVLSQVSFPHDPLLAPAVLSGFAWCDGVNGVAANLLSREFPRAQIVGGRDPQTGAGHSFGRVWSPQYEDWLYFDLWSDEIVVFRRGEDGRAAYLARVSPSGRRYHTAADRAMLARIYDEAPMAMAHNEFRPTFGGYLFLKLRKALTEQTLESITPPQSSLGASVSAPADITFGRDLPLRTYLAARLDHLLGRPEQARRGYEEFLRGERAKTTRFGGAAARFLMLLPNASASPQ